MQLKLLSLIYISGFISAACAWDINRPFPKCMAGEHGINVPGIFSYRKTADGKFMLRGFQQTTICDANVCGCGVVASGSVIPPKYTSFRCKGVVETSAGKMTISFPPNPANNVNLPEPHTICCDRGFFGLFKAGCHTYN